jgi:hypothetical protein
LAIRKLPDQVVRLGVLGLVGIAAMLYARHRFVPATFGETGHYRAAAVDAVASGKIQYAGAAVCAECHDDVAGKKAASYHRTLSCEICHGAAARHAEDPEAQKPVVPRERGAACLYCHEYLPSRPTGFPQIIERLHNPVKPCIGCHDPHDPKPSQVPESCSACHAQIYRTKAVSPHANLSCETCHAVDPRHRQEPRAFLPKKPTDREFCGRCHSKEAPGDREIPRIDLTTHGGRYLCWQCHYPHFPES